MMHSMPSVSTHTLIHIHNASNLFKLPSKWCILKCVLTYSL
ncbi:hypothetical protein NP493_2216g00008 [Ridgeia piscesae]|uniref:Uncharacterized protein n=1 Tax=Ridgeia piscesae TaxID=27915 RepID=A0AAD9JKG7_RIDPI|nr:hypothetical protein NP493_2216g00008 [Ridgeia piscesae]